MTFCRALIASLAALTAGLTLPAAAPADGPMLGIADQKPAMFTDPLFTELKIAKARIVVPWDILATPSQVQELDTWLMAARDAGVRPLIAFGHSRRDGKRRVRPSVRRFTREFRRLRYRYPWVDEWSTWNEANHCGEPLCHRPELAARYYDAIRRTCPTCTILGAEVLDQPNMAGWVRAFRHVARVDPRYWGLHNYLDANRMRTSGTQALLNATRGQIWFTETGGIVRRTSRVKIRFPESAAHAAAAVRWIFRRLVPLSSRITRVYLYHWNLGTGPERWDSALISPHGQPRPAFDVLAREAAGRAQARAGSSP